jgi:hypothetical protein
MSDLLPTGRLAREVREVMGRAEELAHFAESLGMMREVDPCSAMVAGGMGSLHARLEATVAAARRAQATTAFFVREGRKQAA